MRPGSERSLKERRFWLTRGRSRGLAESSGGGDYEYPLEGPDGSGGGYGCRRTFRRKMQNNDSGD